MFPHKETITFCIIKNRDTCYTTCFPILANAQKWSFATSGGVCGAYAVASLPYYRNRIRKIRMYIGRGVLHTPPERFRRKRRGVPMHKNDHSPPPAAFVGRMLLRLYRSWYTDLLTIRFFSFMVFFSCLDARKEPKENQGVRDASQILGIQLIWTYPAKLPCPRQRAFSCLDARKEPKENQGIRDVG